jgi:hypothetical protein
MTDSFFEGAWSPEGLLLYVTRSGGKGNPLDQMTGFPPGSSPGCETTGIKGSA